LVIYYDLDYQRLAAMIDQTFYLKLGRIKSSGKVGQILNLYAARYSWLINGNKIKQPFGVNQRAIYLKGSTKIYLTENW